MNFSKETSVKSWESGIIEENRDQKVQWCDISSFPCQKVALL